MEKKKNCDYWWIEIEYCDPYDKKKIDSPIFNPININGKKLKPASRLQIPVSFTENNAVVSGPKVEDFSCEELNVLVQNILMKNYYLYYYLPKNFTIFKLNEQASVLEVDSEDKIEEKVNESYDAILIKNNQPMKTIGCCAGLYVLNPNMIEKMYLSNKVSLWIKLFSEFSDNDLKLDKNGEFINTANLDSRLYSQIIAANESSSIEMAYICNDILSFLFQSGIIKEGRSLCLKN